MSPDFKPRSNIWFEVDGEVAISRWRIELLRTIARTGSISAAAQAMNIQYRLAWQRIREMEKRLGSDLVVASVGGRGGGGTTLTKTAEQLITHYEEMMHVIDQCVAEQSRRYLSRIDTDL